MRYQQLGSTLILMGTAIGGGMLALPLVSGLNGFLPASLILIAVWLLMTLTGLLVLEVCIRLPRHRNNFHSMAENTLGVTGKILTWVTLLVLLYALTSAYISGASTLLSELLHRYFGWQLPGACYGILFTLVFSWVIMSGTRLVDIMNRGLMSIKGAVLILSMVLLMPKISIHQWMYLSPHHRGWLFLAPIFLTSFGYHTVIPSLCNYLEKDIRLLRRVIIVGTVIPLLIYLSWLAVTLGVVPVTGPYGFQALSQHHQSVGWFINDMMTLSHSHWVSASLNVFANVAVTTSFLGVTLGLFDFIADGLGHKNTKKGRYRTAFLTFAPPLFCSIFFQKGFVFALGFAGLCVAILEVILPAAMAYSQRQTATSRYGYRLIGGTGLLATIFMVGVGLCVLQLFVSVYGQS